MPYPLGDVTKTTFLKLESHKLFHEFEVEAAVTIYPGQPVFISGDEQVSPITTTPEATHLIIGIAMQGGTAGELITVMMKAYAIVFMQAETASLAAGAVRTGSTSVYNATDGYNYVDDASVTAANIIGWALEGGDADDVIRVAIL